MMRAAEPVRVTSPLLREEVVPLGLKVATSALIPNPEALGRTVPPVRLPLIVNSSPLFRLPAGSMLSTLNVRISLTSGHESSACGILAGLSVSSAVICAVDTAVEAARLRVVSSNLYICLYIRG